MLEPNRYLHHVGGLALALGAWLAGGAMAADAVEFTQQPQVARKGNRFELTFAVSAPTDVEVAVLDANGAIVRHLAAGVLGSKAPPPLAAGLSQRLMWDGKDDLGAPAAGPFRFRVRLGMQVRFGRMIGGSPYTGNIVDTPYRAPLNGLVVDETGNLYVKMMSSVGSHGNSGYWPWHLRKFDKAGNYLRTMLPYPPSIAPDKASGFELIKSNQFTPANQTSLYPVFSTLGNELHSRMIDGQLVFINSERRELNLLAANGSNRLTTIPMWPREAKLNCPKWLCIQVAFSPDGKTAYYSNVAGTAYDGKTPADIDADWPQGRVYRQDLTRPGSPPQRFFDLTLPDFAKTKYWMPSAWDKKTAASGIDTDANGNVLVADLVNQQVVEISPQGEQRSATGIEWPDRIMVSRKSSTMYVISRKVSRGRLPPAVLYKISGRGEQAKTVARLPLPGTMGGAYTLDESGQRPVIWLAGQQQDDNANQLWRIEDRGDELVVTGDKFLNRDLSAITFVGYMDVDREAELLYVTRSGGTVWRFDGQTGDGGPLSIKAVDLAVGPGGNIYTWGTSGKYEGPVARFTRDLKPAPLAATGEHTFGYLYGRAGRGSSVCGMDVDAQGRVFATFGTNDCHVRAYDLTGNLVAFDRRIEVHSNRGEKQDVPVAIDHVSGYGGSLRLDLQGNLYLLQHGVPKDFQTPAAFQNDEAYRQTVGTIYKFPPTGGRIEHQNHAVKSAEGAVQSYPDCGPVSRWRADGSCACTKPRFDVDGFGRLYIPNGITYSVSVRDNANNEIVRFGAYGNYDCQGPDSREPAPSIPLGWPIAAGASDRYVYVGDCLNHRVVRVDKRFAVESVIEAK